MQLPHSRPALVIVMLSTCFIGLAACRESAAPTNASEDARISRGMEDVAAGQARSEADVADIETARRQASREKQENAAGGAK